MDEHAQHSAVPAVALLADFRLLVILFVLFRLALSVVYQPAVFEHRPVAEETQVIERGMSAFGDLRYYYDLAARTGRGQWPYRDYWFEFPPVWATLFVGLYHVLDALGTVTYSAWATILGLFMTLIDVGNLYLLRLLAQRLHGLTAAVALPWVYALLIVPVVMPWWNFEPLVAFLLLLGLWWVLKGYRTRSALAVALGILTKYLAILVLPAVWRFRSPGHALRYTLISLSIPVVVTGLLIAWGGAMARESLLLQANKASYQTVWALIDGNYTTGRFPPPDQRFDPATAHELSGNPAVIPVWVRLFPFAALGGWLYMRINRRDDRALVAFVTVTLVLFFLWAQGWSPQWVLTLTPLILLNFPDRNGVLLCAVLGFMSLLEYPGLFSRTAETAGVITGDLRRLFVVLVLLRTALLAGIVVALAGRLSGVGAGESA